MIGMEIETKQTIPIIMQLYLPHFGCEITTHFFMSRIWAFQHCNIIQIEV